MPYVKLGLKSDQRGREQHAASYRYACGSGGVTPDATVFHDGLEVLFALGAHHLKTRSDEFFNERLCMACWYKVLEL